MPETIKLAGREFEVLNQELTASQDAYILAHLRVARAMEILHDAEGTGTKSPDHKRGELLLTQIMLAGETHHILAGCINEVGKKWTRAEADRNAAAFGNITDQDEKNAIRALIIRLVITFLGLAARAPKPSSPAGSAPVPPVENAEKPAEPFLH